MTNKIYDIEHPEKLVIVRDFDENGLAVARYKGRDMCFFINKDYKRVSRGFISADEFDGEYYAVSEDYSDESWAYYAYDGKTLSKASKNYAECLPFSPYVGYGLVKDAKYKYDNGQGDDAFLCYFVDRSFNQVSPLYKDAFSFDENYDVARVTDTSDKIYYVNDEFTKVSPDFSIAFGLDEEGVLVGSKNTKDFAFYEFEDGEFVKKSEDYAMANPFLNNNATTVKDLKTGKWYVIDRCYNKISGDYAHLTAFSGHPAVASYRENGKLKGLTAISLSKINDVSLYADIYRALEEKGYDSELSSITEKEIGSKLGLGMVSAKNEALKDIKLAIRDYLIKNLSETAQQGQEADEIARYINKETKNINKALSKIALSDELENN